MIRVKLTPAMLDLVETIVVRGEDDEPRVLRRYAHRIYAPKDALVAVAASLDADAERAPNGRVRQTAKHAAKRIRDAIAKREAHRVPISITVEEQEAIAEVARGGFAALALSVAQRLERRGLVVDRTSAWDLTDRGRAVAAGTPPGDLVPFAYFEDGTTDGAPVRVRLAFDMTDADGEPFYEGTELLAIGASDGELALARPETPRTCELAYVNPRLVHVLGPS